MKKEKTAYRVRCYFRWFSKEKSEYSHTKGVVVYIYAKNWADARDIAFKAHRDRHWFAPEDVSEEEIRNRFIFFTTRINVNLPIEERKRLKKKHMRRLDTHLKRQEERRKAHKRH